MRETRNASARVYPYVIRDVGRDCTLTDFIIPLSDSLAESESPGDKSGESEARIEGVPRDFGQ